MIKQVLLFKSKHVSELASYDTKKHQVKWFRGKQYIVSK